jgi:hypothetical protein
MGKSPDSEIPPEKLDLYDTLIAGHPEIERKGAANPYTSLNGHMFTFLSKSGQMGLRLPKEEREAFLGKYNTELIVSYGAVMKEYVAVPDDMLANTAELKPYLEISYSYVKSLKPKPTTRKKK